MKGTFTDQLLIYSKMQKLSEMKSDNENKDKDAQLRRQVVVYLLLRIYDHDVPFIFKGKWNWFGFK
jgi:hypothetical protein